MQNVVIIKNKNQILLNFLFYAIDIFSARIYNQNKQSGYIMYKKKRDGSLGEEMRKPTGGKEPQGAVSDEELQKSAVSGDSLAEEQLIKRYSIVVRARSRAYFLAGGESEDLIQEGMIGLISAIRSYTPEGGASFRTYAELCVKRRLYSAIRASYGKKNVSLDDCLSLQSPFFDENQADTFSDLQNAFQRGPEDELIDRENTSAFWEKFHLKLSTLEARILNMYLKGMSYREIASEVRKPVKSIDNAVQRVRKKLTQFISSGDISKS